MKSIFLVISLLMTTLSFAHHAEGKHHGKKVKKVKTVKKGNKVKTVTTVTHHKKKHHKKKHHKKKHYNYNYGSNSNYYYGYKHSKPYYGYGYSYGYKPVYKPVYKPAYSEVAVACSPKMVDSNVTKTDKLANNFLTDLRFKDETKFNQVLSEIKDVDDSGLKLSAYLSMVDVYTKTDIAYFVGARKDELGKYETALIQNTDINSGLAGEVVEKMIKSLRAK